MRILLPSLATTFFFITVAVGQPPDFPPYSQGCNDDAGPPWVDDGETYGIGVKYHASSATQPVGDTCPTPLKRACAVKDMKSAFMEGPVDCGGKGWYCRILEDPNWPQIVLRTDLNFGYCNHTDGISDSGFDQDGHCHGSDDDSTYYWWLRDHFFRQYNGHLRCCCDWNSLEQGRIVNRCDYRRLITSTEDVNLCRDANEDNGDKKFEGGCNAAIGNSQLNQPIPEDNSQCWEMTRFGFSEGNDGVGSGSSGNNNDEGEGESDEEDSNEEDSVEEVFDQEDEESSSDSNEGESDEEDSNEEDSVEEVFDQEDEESSSDSNEGDWDEEDLDEEDWHEEDWAEEEFFDDPNFRFRNKPNLDCEWIGKNPDSRCFRASGRKYVFEYCPESCGLNDRRWVR